MSIKISFLVPASLMFVYVVFTGSILLIFGYIFYKCNENLDFDETLIDPEIHKKNSRYDYSISWSSSERSSASGNATKIEILSISDTETV